MWDFMKVKLFLVINAVFLLFSNHLQRMDAHKKRWFLEHLP